jgi:hypothetical protein
MMPSIYKKLKLDPIGDLDNEAVRQKAIALNVDPAKIRKVRDFDLVNKCRRDYLSENGRLFRSCNSKAGLNENGRRFQRSWSISNGLILSGENDLTVEVKKRRVKFGSGGRVVSFTPKVFLSGIERHPIGDLPVIRGSRLVWNYGFCRRVLDIIEGMCREVYVFDEDPGGDFRVEAPVIGAGSLLAQPMGWSKKTDFYEGDFPDLILRRGIKFLPRRFFNSALVSYPLFVDDSHTQVGNSSRDGYIYSDANTKANAYYGNGTFGSSLSGTIIYQGYFYSAGGTPHRVYRGFYAFNTAGDVQDNWLVTDMDVYLWCDGWGSKSSSTDDFYLQYDSSVGAVYPLGSNKTDYLGLIGSTIGERNRSHWGDEERDEVDFPADPNGYDPDGYSYWSGRFRIASYGDSPSGSAGSSYDRRLRFDSANHGTSSHRPDLVITYHLIPAMIHMLNLNALRHEV